jgi:hypothetical protein
MYIYVCGKCFSLGIVLTLVLTLHPVQHLMGEMESNMEYSNFTSFFRFVNKRASYPFGIISLVYAPMNVTDFSIGSINCMRFNSCEIFYDMTRKKGPLNTGDCLIEVTAWVGLTLLISNTI